MVLYSSCDGVPLKLKKEKQVGLQFTSMYQTNLVLTPLRIRWAITLSVCFCHDNVSLLLLSALARHSYVFVHWLLTLSYSGASSVSFPRIPVEDFLYYLGNDYC
jgi:hypothetical protein